jgi:hypothetical protein
MRAHIYKDNKLEKIEYLSSHDTLTPKAKERLKGILTYLSRLAENGHGNYFVEVKIDKNE